MQKNIQKVIQTLSIMNSLIASVTLGLMGNIFFKQQVINFYFVGMEKFSGLLENKNSLKKRALLVPRKIIENKLYRS